MSPLAVRRYRAERLLREEFDALRGRVLSTVRARLHASGVSVDPADLEACYATAWQGLYTAMLSGREIANPAGWLMLVTYRRAIEEHRTHRRLHADRPPGGERDRTGGEPGRALERDLAAELDDRRRLVELFEGLRGRLGAREREAAVLCYLQGLSRSEAAAQMGVSEARMRKLMEGRPGRPGVAGKVGAIVESIREGGWCEEQSSLMRGLAFGILDPAGERYRLALLHRRECPACRAYVLSLRELAVTLPPVFLPTGVGAGAIALVAGSAHGAAGVGGGAAAGSGAAAGGASAGGGWMMASGAGAKLAVGCALAIGVGAGCVGLGVGGNTHPTHHAHARDNAPPAVYGRVTESPAAGERPAVGVAPPPPTHTPRRPASGPRVPRASHATRRVRSANREFTPEQGGDAGASGGPAPVTGGYPTNAVAASASGSAGTSTTKPAHATPTPARSSPGSESAEREFSPG